MSIWMHRGKALFACGWFVLAVLWPVPAVCSQAVPASEESVGVVSPAAPAPVVFDGTELFTIRERILSFTPEERARAISGRLEKLSGMPSFSPDALGIVTDESGSIIVADDLILMTVTEADARTEGVTHEVLAGSHLDRIRAVVGQYREQRSAEQLMFAGLYCLAATVLAGLLLWMLGRGCRALGQKIESQRGQLIRSIRFQRLELLREERIVGALHIALKAVRLILTLMVLHLYLTFVLRQFPWTRNIAARITDYVTAPLVDLAQGFLAYLPNIFFVGVTIFIAYLVIKVVRLFFGELGKGTITLGGFQPEWADSTFKIVRFLIIAFCLVVIFPYLPGSDSAAFKGISVFLGVLLSLGSSSAVANVVAGVIMTYTGAFKLGDRVRIADTFGDVLEKNLLVTRVRTTKNVDITIPNSLVLSSHVINYSTLAQGQGLILNTTITIGYDVSWRKVHDALIAAAGLTEGILAAPEPFVLQTALNDFYVSYELNAYTDQPNRMSRLYSALHQNIQDCFNEAGIEIMSPHYSALRDGNQSTIPAEYLGEGYAAPKFRV